MPVTPVKMTYTLTAPCGAKYEFTSDRIHHLTAKEPELSLRFADFLKALGLEPMGWQLSIDLNGYSAGNIKL